MELNRAPHTGNSFSSGMPVLVADVARRYRPAMAMDSPSPSSTVVAAERSLMFGTWAPPMVVPPMATSRTWAFTVSEI